MKIIEETIPLIEKALDIRLYPEQTEYLLHNGSYWFGNRRSGKTLAYSVKLALSEGEPINMEKPLDFCDSPHIIKYSLWFRSFFLKIWQQLKFAGLPVRELSYNYVNESSVMLKNEDIRWSICPKCGQKLCRITTDSKAQKIYLWCKQCKKEIEINI